MPQPMANRCWTSTDPASWRATRPPGPSPGCGRLRHDPAVTALASASQGAGAPVLGWIAAPRVFDCCRKSMRPEGTCGRSLRCGSRRHWAPDDRCWLPVTPDGLCQLSSWTARAWSASVAVRTGWSAGATVAVARTAAVARYPPPMTLSGLGAAGLWLSRSLGLLMLDSSRFCHRHSGPVARGQDCRFRSLSGAGWSSCQPLVRTGPYASGFNYVDPNLHGSPCIGARVYEPGQERRTRRPGALGLCSAAIPAGQPLGTGSHHVSGNGGRPQVRSCPAP